ncbi:hypothetical protein K502DRAFT_326362 [Neoconidiobolus thromboides FSU 785]|nr:hypothetical protein K502DRAFT_326362 [Neoconidiobolus thromboides FSU 785]
MNQQSRMEDKQKQLVLSNFYVKKDGEYLKKEPNMKLDNLLTKIDFSERFKRGFETKFSYTVEELSEDEDEDEETKGLSAEEIAEELICARLEIKKDIDQMIDFDDLPSFSNTEDNNNLLNINSPNLYLSDIEFSDDEFNVSLVAQSIPSKSESSDLGLEKPRMATNNYVMNINDIVSDMDMNNSKDSNSNISNNNINNKRKSINNPTEEINEQSTYIKRTKIKEQSTPIKSSTTDDNNKLESHLSTLHNLTVTNQIEDQSKNNIDWNNFNSFYKSLFVSDRKQTMANTNGKFV